MTTQLVTKGFVLLDGAAEFGSTGLTLTRELTFDEFRTLGDALQIIESGIQWVLGDWINAAERSFGEEASDLTRDTGYTYQSLADFGWVASRIPRSRRREALRFSHHRVVAPLDPAEQDRLLALAEDETWSVERLREEAKKYTASVSSRDEKTSPVQPTRELPVHVTVADSKPEHEPDPVDGLTKELEATQREADQLRREIESLESDDKDRELRKLHAELAQTQARINQLLTEKNEAVKQARWAMGLLDKIRKAVGVQSYSDILAKISTAA